MKYIDHIAYPIMLAVIYVLLGFVKWDSNPANWDLKDRWLWIIWGLAWGFALRQRILRELGRNQFMWMPE
jgi:hypothetical protein